MEYPKERYAQWGGNPKGNAYKPDRCAESIWTSVWDMGRQCSRPNGHGEGGLFCKQHAKRHTVNTEEMDR